MSVTVTFHVRQVFKDNITWLVRPYLEGMELEENIMGEDRPTYCISKPTIDVFSDMAATGLIECLEIAYKKEKAYIESIGETLMKVETVGGLTMYSMTGKGTPCSITEEYATLRNEALYSQGTSFSTTDEYKILKDKALGTEV
jgi:hypothetical protein